MPGPGRGREGWLEAPADARLRELGRRGIRPRRLDRVGRRARRRDRPEGRSDAQRRLGRIGPEPRPRRRPLAPRLAARCGGRRDRRPHRAGPSATSGSPSGAPRWASGRHARPRRDDLERRPGLGRVARGAAPPGSRPSSTRWARAPTTRRSSTTWACPRIDVGFNGRYGVYHSIYDDFFWMERFGDPEFVTHATAARLYTLLAMRAASGRGRAAQVHALRRRAPRPRRRPPTDDRAKGPRRRPRPPSRRWSSWGCPGWSRPSKHFQAQAAGRRPRDGRPGEQGQHRARAAGRVNDALTRGRAVVPRPRRPARPSLVQARDLRPGADDRLRIMAAAGRPPGGHRQRRRTVDGAGRPAGRAARCGLGCPESRREAGCRRAPRPPRGRARAAPKPVVGNAPKADPRPGGPER